MRELRATDKIECIAQGLEDADNGVKVAAIFALGDLATPEAVDILKKARRDEKDKDLWEIVVTNAMTGENVYKSTVSDSAIQINTSLWKSGFYIVQGKINSKIYSEKIYKK